MLSCDKINVPIQHAYILALTDVEKNRYSENVSIFKRKISESTQSYLSNKIENIEIQSTEIDQITQIIDWAKRNGIKNIVTLACPCGYVRDFVNLLKKELSKESIEIIKIYRDYDCLLYTSPSPRDS